MVTTLLDQLTVRRGTPSLVSPARPTPQELKCLSDIDDQESMRIYSSWIHLFRGGGEGSDPAAVVRAALAEALVHYYPLAGRLRELAGRKLVVECAGQGVVFVVADADITVDDLGDVRCPPFPRSEEFLYNDDHLYMSPASHIPAIIDRPLLYVQVTRLKCGGFIVGHRNSHCLCDAPGVVQFWNTIGELARGAAGAPSVPPVWARELFDARQPPSPSFPHIEYQEPVGQDRIATTPRHDIVRVPLSFGPKDIAAMRSRVPAGCSRFDLIAACVWRSRTAALGYAPGDEVRLSIVVNGRGRRPDAFGRELPQGFYGNAFGYAAAACTAGELCDRDMGYAVELIREAKGRITYEYLRSAADMMVLQGRPLFAINRTLMVSDLGLAGFGDVEFGSGKAVYSGPAKPGVGIHLGVNTYFLRLKDDHGVEQTLVPICLPTDCTARFQLEVDALINPNQH